MRFALLFLLIGLAVGLWLGFNPDTHRELVRWWDRTERNGTAAAVPGIVNTRQLSRKAGRLLQSAPRPQPAPQSQPSVVPTNPQISAELQTFWNALQRMWLQFVASLRGAK